MKKIDGLRIDYEQAAGDLVLPPEFLGQPAGRQLGPATTVWPVEVVLAVGL